ncbi:MAG TPA: GTP pyrophosphokinase family protein [Cellulomonas sp.]
MVTFARQLRDDFGRLIMEHQFGVDEVLTKVSILQQEFVHLHRYNPIEHISSRVKSPQSILDKVLRRGVEPSVEAIRANLTDIAGIRITCSFIADTYRILDTLTAQDDIRVITVKDYIAHPKPNGYKSLHAIIEIPVFLSTGPVPVVVEVQIRTIAMDFWASLEHKIYYKYDGAVPGHLTSSLAEAAAVAEQLDRRMEELHTEVRGAEPDVPQGGGGQLVDDRMLEHVWRLSRARADSTGPVAGVGAEDDPVAGRP